MEIDPKSLLKPVTERVAAVNDAAPAAEVASAPTEPRPIAPKVRSNDRGTRKYK